MLGTANVFPSWPIDITLMMEAVRSSETTVLTRATLGNIPESAVLQTMISFLHRLLMGSGSGFVKIPKDQRLVTELVTDGGRVL
jgi:hypothetical protein